MTQKDKQLLLKDLCGRLPYGVKFPYHIDEDSNHRECDCVATMDTISEETVEFSYVQNGITRDWTCIIKEVKPYLRPMSSMTDGERKHFESMCCWGKWESGPIITLEAADWLNEHCFDYRGLIEKGLALEAPEGTYNV